MKLEEQRSIIDAATKGPWELGWNKPMTGPTVPTGRAFCGEWDDEPKHVCLVVQDIGPRTHSVIAVFPERAARGDANLAFAAAAREEWPRALKKLEAVAVWCDKWRDDTSDEGEVSIGALIAILEESQQAQGGSDG